MRVLITGGGGQLAADLCAAFSQAEVISLARQELDICAPEQIEARLDAGVPDVVLNTAAFHKVDVCESDPEESFRVNAAAPHRLAAACKVRGITLVHYSTDYVFDGEASEPYPENAPVNPISVYGVSKAAGEMAIRCTGANHLIVRTTGLYGLTGAATARGNFVETMIKLGTTREVTGVVADQTLTPTSTEDLAALTRQLIEAGARGTVHATSGGRCTWYEFASEIFRLAELPGRVEPIPHTQFPTPARRPTFSVLAHTALPCWGVPEPRPWQEALADYLRQRASVLSPHRSPGTANATRGDG